MKELDTGTCDLLPYYYGYLSPNKQIQYFLIHKNASSSIENNLQQLGWAKKEIDLRSQRTLFVVLRDPFERWISGFVEDVGSYENKEISKKLIENINGDSNWLLDFLIDSSIFQIGWHTRLQCCYEFMYLPRDKIVFFKHGDNLNFKLHHWLLGEGIASNFLNSKYEQVLSGTSLYTRLQQYFSDAKNQDKKTKLLQHLKPDYDLMNSITFY
jgi:hypothetical protein